MLNSSGRKDILALFPILGKASNFSLLSMKSVSHFSLKTIHIYKIALPAKAKGAFGEVTGRAKTVQAEPGC